MEVLIIGQQADAHVSRVRDCLEAKGVNTQVFEQLSFPSESALSFDGNGSVSFCNNNKQIDLGHVDLFWLRRFPKIIPCASEDPVDLFYIQQESHDFLLGLFEILKNKTWIWDPYKITRAGRKVYQLYIANQVGLKVPGFIFGNDVKLISEFTKFHQRVAIKPVKATYLAGSHFPKQKLLSWGLDEAFRTLIRPENAGHIASLKSDLLEYFDKRVHYTFPTLLKTHDELVEHNQFEVIKNCPVIVQEYIDKKIEVRVTIIGPHVFSVAIDSQADDPSRSPFTKVDWRMGFDKVNLIQYTLPDKVIKLLYQYLEMCNLESGCIDLIIDKNEEIHFLENNPLGAWDWVEDRTEFQISDAMASFLINKSSRS